MKKSYLNSERNTALLFKPSKVFRLLLMGFGINSLMQRFQIKSLGFSALFYIIFLLTGSVSWGQISLSGGSVATGVSTNTTTSTTLTIPKPSGLEVGDIMIVQVVQSGNNNTTAIGDATSSGWTEIAGSTIRTGFGNYSRATLLYKIVTSTDVAATNFSFTLDGNSDDGEGGITAFTGVDNTNPFDVTSSTTYTNIATDQTLTATAITTATANSAIIMFGAMHDNVNLSTWTTVNPGSLTELYDVDFSAATVDIGMGAAWALKPAIGSTGAGSATISGGSNINNGSLLIALRPCTANPTITTSGTATSVCFSTSAQTTTLPYTATTNGPISYSIDWNAVANAAGLADQTTTSYTFLTGAANMPNIAIPASLTSATYSGTLTIRTSGGCRNTQAISVTVNPTVGTPVFSLGATSTRCQGAGSVTYAATASNSTGLTYSLDATTLAFTGNSIDASGAVTYAAGWSGTSTITASAAGCSGPATATHTVTITPTVGTPVFGLGATSSRCQGAGNVTYAATATNNTGLIYSLDATSLAFSGNSIVAGTGVVTFAAGWSGTSTITVSASGCNGPTTATHTVTVNPRPTAFNVTGTGAYCSGGSGLAVGLSGSETGVDYQLYNGATPIGSPVAGTGSAISFGSQTGTTTYTVIATNATTSCTTTMTGSAVVTINPLPDNQLSDGFVGGTFCSGNQATLTFNAVNGSGFPYTLTYNDGTTTFFHTTTIAEGDGDASWTVPVTTNTSYTLTSITNVYGCSSIGIAKSGATVIFRPDPTATISGNAVVCQGASSPSITFTNPQTAGITITYTINGGANQTVNVVANGTATVPVSTTTAGPFVYELVSVDYSTNPACTQPLTGSATVTVTATNTATAASSSPTLCINTALLSPITHTTTGATGIGASTGLPTGVTASWAANTITISGTPSVSGTFNYSIPLTGGCGSVNATGTIIVLPDNTVSAASSSPTLCINTALTAITHTTTVATGIGTASGLPAGVTASWASNTITISGTPSESGTFGYSIPLIGGCGVTLYATGTIIVTPNNTVSAASSSPTLCIGTVLTSITHTTTGATGIGASTGLPTGVTASWASNIITISGTPSASGTFNYSIPLTGGCGAFAATGTIIVTPENTVSVASSSPTICINTALIAITHTTTGATGIGVASGLPTGVTASWASDIITISGTPSVIGTFNYSIPLTGGCASVIATGTIIVDPNNTVSAASSSPTLCISTVLTAITHSTTGATGIGVSTGLPTGVTASWASNTITISGTPSASGTFNYSIPLTGGCTNIYATGTITVNPLPAPAGAITGTTPVCQGQLNVVYSVPAIANATDYIWTLPAGASITTGLGTNSITVNYSMVAVSGNITVKGKNACGDGVISNYPVTVNITPFIDRNYDATACSGELATVTPTNGGGNIVPSGTTYSWGLPTTAVPGVITGATSLSGQTSFNQTLTLTNITNTAQTASYTVTASTGGCSATTFSVLVTVYPKPTVSGSPLTQPICSGGAISPIVFSNPNGIAGTIDYNWTRIDATAITGITGTGSGTITGNLTNTTNSPLTAVFRVIATTQNGCDSLPFDVSVVVNPIPTVAATPATQPICSGNPITAIVLSNPNGVPGPITYSWTRDNTTNVTGIAASGSGASIAGSLTNTTNTVQTTTFTIKATANSCDSATTTVTVTVNPRPTVAVSTATQTICGNDAISPITITNPNNVAATFSWTRNNTTNVTGIAASGSGDTISGNLVNTTNSNQLVTFTVTATAAGCASTTTTSTVTVKPTPTVAVNNSAQTICSASAITTMTITNPNSVAGTTYSWTRNNTAFVTGIAPSGSGTTFPGTISGTLTNNQTTTQTTTFTITATAANGCSSTSTATVTVYAPLVAPVISASQDVCNSQTPTPLYISTAISGGSGSYTYQWQRATNAAFTTGLTTVGTASTYAPGAVLFNDYFYRLIVTDAYCTSNKVTSNSVYINALGIGGVFGSPVVSNAPSPTIAICPGIISPAIGVSITHSPFSTVQFYWTADAAYISPATGGPVGEPTSTSTSYNLFGFTAINNTNATITTPITISPRFTNFLATCNSESAIINIQIRPTPTATATVPNAVICNSTSAFIAVKGNITDATTTLSWVRSDANSNVSSTAASGSNTPVTFGGTYIIPDILSHNEVTAQTVIYTITPTSNGCPGTSITVTIVVAPSINAGTVGAVQTICSGDTPAAFTQTGAPSGGSSYGYQWYSSTTSATGPWAIIGGATATGYSAPALTQNTWYQRVVTANVSTTPSPSTGVTYTATSNSCTANNTAIAVTINNINPGTIAGTQAVCNGSIPIGFTNVTLATGGNTPTYQWQVSTNGADCITDFTDIPGATGVGYTPAAGLTVTTYYRRKETSTLSGKACVAYSNCITVTINNVTAGTVGSDQTICGNNPDAFTVITAATGSGVLSYQWQSNTTGCGGSWGNISGATSATYDAPPGLLATTYYRRVVTSTLNGNSCSINGNCITVTANSVTAGAISGNRTICSGGDPTAFTEITPATGAGITYQWQYSLTGGAGPWTNIAGATDFEYDAPGPITQNTYYRREVKSSVNGYDCYASPLGFVVVFVNNVTPSMIAGNQSVCGSADPVAFTVSTAATGTGTLSYQWQSNTTGCGGSWSAIPGATSATYDAGPVAQTTYYQVVITSTMNGVQCTATSNCVTITHNPNLPAAVSISESANTICAGTSVTFTATPTNGGTTPVYQWKLNGGNVGTNSTTYTNAALVNGDVVTCIMTSNASPCLTGSPATSNPITMIVPALSVTLTSTGTPNACLHDLGILNVTETAGVTIVSRQWGLRTVSGGPIISLTGAIGSSLDPNDFIDRNDPLTQELEIPDEFFLVCTSTSSCGVSAVSNEIYVNGPPRSPGPISGSQSQCVGSTGQVYSVLPVVGATSYNWYLPSDWVITAGAGTRQITVTIGGTSAGNIRVHSVNSCGESYGGSYLYVTVAAVTVAGTVTPTNAVTCGVNPQAVLTVSGFVGTIIGWESSPNISFSPLTVLPNTGHYELYLSSLNTTYTQDTYFRSVALNGNCGLAYSAPVLVRMKQPMTNPTELYIDGTPYSAGVTHCANTSNVLSINPVTNAETYEWIVPSGWTITSGQGTTSINVTTGGTSTSGTVEILAKNGGCNDAHSYFYFYLVPSNAPTVNLTQPTCTLATGAITVTSPAPASGITYTVVGTNPVVAAITNTTGVFTNLAPGNYDVTSNNGFYLDIIGTYPKAITTPTSNCATTTSVTINPLDTNTWNGSVWSDGTPNINQNLVFNAVAGFSSTANVDGCSCTVTTGAVTFNSGHTLKITNWVHVNGGSLTFENNASLVQINNVTNIGNITYKRNFTGGELDYTYWSSPVAGQNLLALSPSTKLDKFFSFNPTVNDWVQENPATATMDIGKGYIIRGIPPPPGPPPGFGTNSFIGVPNNGHYEITSVIPDGSYLLGNPYPSALDANAFLNANQNVLDGTLYFWTHNTPIAVDTPNPGTGLYAYSGDDYASYNLTGGVGTQAPSSVPPFTGLNDNIPSGKIASGQGFFGSSKVTPTGSTIVYNNNMRVGVGGITGDNTQFFKTKDSKIKTATELEKHRIWLNLTNIQGAFKQTLVGYVTDATNGYEDRFDGESYDGNDFLDFYSVNQEKNLTIQGRALPFDTNDEIPLGYRVVLDGTFTIKIGKTDGMLSNQTVYLEDKLTNSVFNLKEGNYTFTTTAGTFDDRFVLRYTDKTLSTEDLELNDGITVLYSNNYKTLIIRNNVKDTTVISVSLYNIAGQNIANWDVKGREQTSIQIPIKNLPSEIYIVKVKTTNGESSKKIIIK